MTGRGRRGAFALWAALAAAAALLACAPAGADPPPISIVVDDGLVASDSGSALPPVSLGTGESIGTSDGAIVRLALALAQAEGIAIADSPSFLLSILLQRGEPISAADAVVLRLGIAQTASEPIGVGDAVSVTPAVAPTTTAVVSSRSPALAGTAVTFTATVADGPAVVRAGSVVFSADGTPLGAAVPVDAFGVAQLTTSALAPGSHTIRASYGGAAGLLPSSGEVGEDVWDYTLTLTPSSATVQRGGTATFTVGAALVPGSATTGLPPLSLSSSVGALAPQLALPGTTPLQVATDATTPLGDEVVTVTADPGGRTASAHLYVNVPPAADAGGPYVADEGSTLTLHGSATDADGDALTYAWDVGGVHASGADAQVAVPDGPATLQPALTVCDDHGACTTATSTLTVANVPPSVKLTATPSPAKEGGTFTLSAQVTDPSAADTAAGFTFEFDCGGGAFAAAASPSTTCPAADDPGVTARARVTDKDGGSTVATMTVPIADVAPTVTITAPAPGSVVFVGQSVPLAASFADPGAGDTHTASFAVAGATVPATVTEAGGSGTTAATWTADAAGIDALTASVTDNGGATGSASQTLIVADPRGFVAGAGWIGPAHNRLLFTLAARYPNGAATPSGVVAIAGRGVVFGATSFGWLVVSGKTAVLQGTGAANGAGGYSFRVQAVDGRPNQFAIKIWKTATGAVLLDTGAPQALAGGTLTVGG